MCKKSNFEFLKIYFKYFHILNNIKITRKVKLFFICKSSNNLYIFKLVLIFDAKKQEKEKGAVSREKEKKVPYPYILHTSDLTNLIILI